MAGTHFRIDLDDAAARAAFKSLVGRAENLATPMAQVGEYLLREMWPKRFEEKRGPDGSPWAPVSEWYAHRKRRGKATQASGDARTRNPADLLQLTGDLMEYPRYQVDGDALEFGVNVEWAATHQFGDPSRNIPARPYMYMDEDDRAEAARLFLAWVRGA